LSTLVDKALRADLETACTRFDVAVVNVLDPVLTMFQEQFGEAAIARPGRQYVWTPIIFAGSTPCITCWRMMTARRRPGIAEADVVLVGVSRSSKTPTSFYLANRGIKAANIPLVPGTLDPPGLENPLCPVIGLTLDAPALIEIRRHRLKLIGTGPTAGIVRQDTGEYVDHEAVKAELLWARRLWRAAWLAGDRRHAPLHRGDGGDGHHADGILARASAQGGRSAGFMSFQPNATPIILASASQTRRALLTGAGLTFESRAAHVDEAEIKRSARAEGISAEDTALLLAELKAHRVPG